MKFGQNLFITWIALSSMAFPFLLLMLYTSPIKVDVLAWECTASKVVKESLPREEECTQWTKEDKGDE